MREMGCDRYHLGSLAFGSLIIALVQMVRSFLEYLDRKLKSAENDVAKFILKYVLCVCVCVCVCARACVCVCACMCVHVCETVTV